MLIEASLIDGLTYSPQCIKPLLAALLLVEEVADRLFDQFVTASIVAVSEFAFDLFCQIRRQWYVHDPCLFMLRVRGAIPPVFGADPSEPGTAAGRMSPISEDHPVAGAPPVMDPNAESRNHQDKEIEGSEPD
jgi:hypothetical protein